MTQLPPDISATSDRKTTILAAALAVFSEKGVDATTIDDIRQRSQASVGSIYHHFGTKEGIAAALLHQGLDDYWSQLITGARSQPNAKAMIHGLIKAHLAWISEQPDMARYLFSSRQAIGAAYESDIRERTSERVKELVLLFKPWFQQGVLRRLPSDLYAPLLIGPAQEYARMWLKGRCGLEPSVVVEELSLAAWRSLACDQQADDLQK
jgi:AcrR family transcriptional regulator